MAEAALSFALKKLDDIILTRVDLHRDVHQQVNLLKEELVRMRCFLKYADIKQDEDERVRNWVSEIRNVAYDTEDLIDNFILLIDSPEKQKALKKPFYFLKHWKLLPKIANEFKDIRGRLQSISASRETYGIRNIGEGEATMSETLKAFRSRMSSVHAERRDVVGLEEDTGKLVAQLVETGDRWRAISIVGMAGIGKTTLAREAYNHPDIKARFLCRAWVHISQDFSGRDVVRRIIRQLPLARKRLESLGDDELEDFLHESLRTTRYLLVLDDLWDTKHWNLLAKAFPERNNGSRILLTTRNNKVAEHVDGGSNPYALQFLNEERSWELFCNHAFSADGGGDFSLPLEEIGKEIMDRCGGLPLAIIVIGGLLSKEMRVDYWKRVLNNIYSHFARDPDGVSAILALSYNDLPYHLKSCFLYLGHFPEEYLIPTNKLFRLWVAEGLIPDQGERMEDVAEDCLKELIQRNMVQIELMSINGRVKQCRLHDLLRELAISKAKEQNFLEIPGNENFRPSAKCRRHPIYSDSHLSSLRHFTPHIRSLLFFNVRSHVRFRYFINGNLDNFNTLSSSNLGFISKSFKLLRTLELEGISCSNIPGTIGKLIHLKYLGLKATNINTLPSTLGSLRNLQTLDIGGNLDLQMVPNVIMFMTNLRHLYMNGSKHGSYLQVDTLKHLQTLLEIHVDSWKKNNSAELSSLRKLGLRGKLSSDTNKIFNSIAVLQELRSLYLHADEDVGFPSLARLADLQTLTKLHLRGLITQLPSPREFPFNLIQLTLEHTHLEQVSIEILKNLSRLQTLILKVNSYSNQKLAISANGFPQLEFLEFVSLDCLEELNVEEGAVRRLKSFRIVKCERLKMLPEEMRFVTTLHELVIREMPKDFVDKLQGQDRHKVQHIPSVKYV